MPPVSSTCSSPIPLTSSLIITMLNVKIQISIGKSSFTVVLLCASEPLCCVCFCANDAATGNKMTARQSREAEVVQPHRCEASASLQPAPRPSSARARNRPRVHSVPHKSTCISGDIQRGSTPSFHFLLNVCPPVCVGRQSENVVPQQ